MSLDSKMESGLLYCALVALFLALFAVQAKAEPAAKPSPGPHFLDLIQQDDSADTPNLPVDISLQHQRHFKQVIRADGDGVSFKNGNTNEYTNVRTKSVCLSGDQCRDTWPKDIDCTQNLPAGAAFGYVAKVQNGDPVCKYYTPTPVPSPTAPKLCLSIGGSQGGSASGMEESLDFARDVANWYGVVAFGAGAVDNKYNVDVVKAKLMKINKDGTLVTSDTIEKASSRKSTQAYVELPPQYVGTEYGFSTDHSNGRVTAVYLRGVKLNADGSIADRIECSATKGSSNSTCAKSVGIPNNGKTTCMEGSSTSLISGIGIGIQHDSSTDDALCRSWVKAAPFSPTVCP